MLQHKWTWCLTIFILSISIIACGGGSSNEESPDENGGGGGVEEETDGDNVPPSQVNDEKSGYLFFAEDSTYLDLDSGKLFNFDVGNADVSALPSSDGLEYVTTIKEYQYFFYSSNDAIIIKNMLDGRIQSIIEISSSIYGGAQFSPDRQMIAAIWQDESSGESYGEDRLTLLSRDGQVLSRSTEQNISSFDWLSDGRLVYTTGNAIYLTTQPGDVSSSRLVTSFDDAMGTPIKISASPDATRLSFELYTYSCPLFVYCRVGSVWIMNTDGSGLHQLATSNDDEPMVNSTVWSPDGNWVVTVEGFFGGMIELYDPLQPGGEWYWEQLQNIPGVVYAVPSTAESVILPGDGSSGASPIAATTEDGLKCPLGGGFSPTMKWVAEIPVATEVRGSLPENTAALSGSLYVDYGGGHTTAMHRVNVQDATDQILFNLTDFVADDVSDLVYSSRDGQYFSHFHCCGEDGSMTIFDRNGQILADIPSKGSGYEFATRGALRFSPANSDLLLVSYTNYLSGSDTFADDFVTVLNWRTLAFLKHFNSREYEAADWTADGNILLADTEGNVHRANVTGETISDPVLFVSGHDPIQHIAVSPDGNSIAITMNGQIWISEINGDNLHQLTGFTSGLNMYAEWSPDGRYIAFKHMKNNDNSDPTDSGKVWVVAADGEHIEIRETVNTPNAIPIMRGDRQLKVFGSYSWR